MKPLEGLRVIDATEGPVGGLATMVLADFGADVVKLERSGGDPARAQAHARTWLRGKQSLICSDVQARELIVATADALVTDRPLDASAFCRDRPDLVIGVIESFDGLPNDEGLVAARLGRMMVFRGSVGRDGPVYSAVQVATHATAQSVAAGVIASLYAREQTGCGTCFKTTLAHGLLPYEMGGLLAAQLQQRGIELPFAAADPLTLMPTINYHPVQCADGRWLQLGNLLPHLLTRFLHCAGLDDVIGVYGDQPATWPADVLEAFRDRMLAQMQTRTAAAWMKDFVADGGIVAHPHQTTQQALFDPDLVANGHVAVTQEGTQLGLVARLTQTPGAVGAHVPPLGNADIAVLMRRKLQIPARSAARQRPLEGVTVVEFATIIAAPLGTAMLADMGARVIKVEAPEGDPFRAMGGGIGAARVNSGKESVCLDLKSVAGQRIARQLIARADVVVHNYRVGVPERLGIGYADACAHNAKLVYVTVNGYGPDGPGALRPSTHPIPGAALGGVTFQLGGELPRELLEGPALRDAARRISRANELNPDPNTSMVVATAVSLGLAAVARCGVAQQVFVDMFGANAYANFDDFCAFDGKLPRQQPDAAGHGPAASRRLYPCADGWLYVACDAATWRRVAAELDLAREEVFRSHDVQWWSDALLARGVRCVRADTGLPAQCLLAPGPAERLVVRARSSEWGDYLRPAPQLEFPGVAAVGGTCRAGEHTEAILREFGGAA